MYPKFLGLFVTLHHSPTRDAAKINIGKINE